MARDLPPDLVKETCGHCPLQPTKTGNEPPWLQYVISRVSELETRKRLGILLQNGPLSPREIQLMDAAQRGRDRSEKARLKKSKPNNPANNNKLQIPKGMGSLD